MVTAADAKQWARENLKGFWASPLLTLNSDYTLDFRGLAANVDHLIEGIGLDGLGYLHEAWTLSPDERTASMAGFVSAVRGRRPVYVHAADHSSELTVDLVNFAANVGADAVMMHPPYEWAKSDEMIYSYYSYIASKTDIAILLLNTPHSGRLMSPELISKIAEIPAVCGLKDGIVSVEASARTHELAGDKIIVSHAHEDGIIESIARFDQQVELGNSWLFALQAPDFQPIRTMVGAAKEGDIELARQIFDAIRPARDLRSEMYSVLWGDAPEHPIAMSKVWLEAMGMVGGPVRPPATNVPPHRRQEFHARVIEAMAASRINVEKLGVLAAKALVAR
jgi:4-hydroxy-tetrahydrodipicolinate synthase